jgi:hypothetical protein
MIELTEEEQKKLDSYPKMEISIEDFERLPEYSLSNPTQDEHGLGVKKWRGRTPHDAMTDEAIWFIGQVEGEMINFYHAEIKYEKADG